MLNKFPAGWDEYRVRRVVDHYENQSDEEAVAEDEAVLAEEALKKFTPNPSKRKTDERGS